MPDVSRQGDMANPAPSIAHPGRRLAAGFVDLVLSLMSAGVISWIAQTSGYESTSEVRLGLAVYMLYHATFYWLWAGQTPGLRIFDIRTVSVVGGVELSLWQVMARGSVRPILLYLCGWAASSTTVPSNIVAVIVLAPLLAELGMMLTLPTRQTFADVVSRTLVINVPPPQPHRAPAAPMYSATDAEFGVRPRRIR